jgi:hypothetical protein
VKGNFSRATYFLGFHLQKVRNEGKFLNSFPSEEKEER